MPRPLAAAVWLITYAFCVTAAAAVYLQAGNTLVRNGRWSSSKLSLEGSVPGAAEAFTTRAALKKNRLNLGVSHGFQEFIAARADDYKTIDFDFLLSDSSYFTFIFNKSGDGFNGIRLSRDDSHPSAFISASNEGEFLEVRPLTGEGGDPKGWNHARIALVEGQALFVLNGKLSGFMKIPRKKTAQFGFRGSQDASSIDNVVAKNFHEDIVVRDSFGNLEALGYSLLAFGLSLGLIHGIIFLIRGGALPGAMAWGSIVSLLLALVAARFYAVDPSWILPQYPDPSRFSTYQEVVELNDFVTTLIRTRFPSPGRRRRVLFLGNSQTKGSGAKYLEDRMTERLERKLGPGFECINGSVVGSSSTTMLENLKSEWFKLEPSLIVLNLSNDRSDTLRSLGPDVETIIRLARKQGIETLLVLPANEPLSISQGLAENHRIIREVAAREKVAVADLHGFLMQHHDSGFLWWDRTHLTSYGQRLAADYLYPTIAKLSRR